MIELSNSDLIALSSAAVSLISAVVVIKQYQDSRKPALSTWVSKNMFDHSLRGGADYLYVKNVSENLAGNFKVQFQFSKKSEKPFIVEFLYPYLNPGETAEFLIPIAKFLEKHESMFREVNVSDKETITVPINDLILHMNVRISCKYGVLPVLNTEYFCDDFRLDWRAINENDLYSPNLFFYHEREGRTITNSDEIKPI